jgi:hypothetical protein
MYSFPHCDNDVYTPPAVGKFSSQLLLVPEGAKRILHMWFSYYREVHLLESATIPEGNTRALPRESADQKK